MGRLHAHVRPHVRPHSRSSLEGPYGGSGVHDGISFNAANGRVVIKPAGSAATVTTLTSAFTFTGGNQSLYRGPGGLLIQSVTNTPRIEYGPGGDVLGLLMEASRTNLALQSADFTTTWSASSVTVSTNVIAAPDGTTTADKVVETAVTAPHFVTQNVTKAAANTVYTISCYVKAAERTFAHLRAVSSLATGDARVAFDLTTGTAGTAGTTGVGFTAGATTITPFANGWFRCTFSFTSDADTTVSITFGPSVDATTSLSYAGNVSNGVYVWGYQLEAASFASSYIPTTTVSVARTADSCIRTLGSEFSATAGTVVVAGRASGGQDAAAAQFVYNFDDGTTSNRIGFGRPAAVDTGSFRVFTATVAQAVLDSTFSNSTAFKHAAAWAANDFANSFNGATVLLDSAGTLPTVTSLFLGLQVTAVAPMNGHIRTFDYYPSRLANSYLQQAST